MVMGRRDHPITRRHWQGGVRPYCQGERNPRTGCSAASKDETDKSGRAIPDSYGTGSLCSEEPLRGVRPLVR